MAHPLNNETRRSLEERVLAEYRQVVDDPTPRRPDRQPGASAAEPAAAEPAKTAETQVPSSEVVVAAADAAPPPDAVPPPGVATPDAVNPGEMNPGEKSLEEVQELHLRDSFWSVS